jgi:uncharacterized protein YndB with AHSA1/START domain
MPTLIRQTVMLPAPPRAVYRALLESRRHTAFTGQPARLSQKEGGSFSCYNGYITGWNLDVVPSKRIVQAWRAKGWPPGVYSIATFSLSPMGRGKTRITFTHLGVPASSRADIDEGWRTYYWKPLKAYLES